MKTNAFILLFLLTLSGCATTSQPNISQYPNWDDKSMVIGVAIADTATPTAYKSSHLGVLETTITPNTQELKLHLKTLDISNINDIASKLTKLLKSRGLKVKNLTNKLDLNSLSEFDNKKSNSSYCELDHRKFKSRYGIDKLVVINIKQIGTIRNYYGFVPLDEPRGLSHLDGYIVNLDTNQLEWKQNVIKKTKNNSDNWNSASKFEGLTKAIYLSFDQAKNTFLNYFAK